MKTILYLASAIYFAVSFSHASSSESSLLLDPLIPEKSSLIVDQQSLQEFSSSVASIQIKVEQPVVSGLDIKSDSTLGTFALFAGMVGMTFVMIRRRQAS